jgi:hypothetical protein
MKVCELVQQLSKLPQNLEVYLWVDGERHRAHSIDDSFIDENIIDINAENIHNPHGDY